MRVPAISEAKAGLSQGRRGLARHKTPQLHFRVDNLMQRSGVELLVMQRKQLRDSRCVLGTDAPRSRFRTERHTIF